MNKMKNFRMRKVDESSFGLYVWKLPTGEILGDEDGNILNVPSEQYNLGRIKILRDAATHYGYPEGEPLFMSGRRRVTDEEEEEQIERMKEGKTPDIYDAPALLDELAAKEQHGTS
jgi:hypothetical protein